MTSYSMLVSDDYSILLSNEGSNIEPYYRLVSFISKSKTVAFFFEFFKGVKFINKQKVEINRTLQKQNATFKLLIESLAEKNLKGKDLSDIINTIENSILMLAEHKNTYDKLLENSSTKLFTSFADTSKLIDENINCLYVLLRIFKKNNKRKTFPISQLAKDTTEHSENTLTEILNAN